MTQTPLAATAPQTQANATLDEAIQSLRQSFCDGLDEKICRIETAWIGLRKAQVDTNEALGLISHEAHRISGIAGSLGFAHIGTQANALEMRIAQTSKNALSLEDISQLDSEINDFLDQLENILTET